MIFHLPRVPKKSCDQQVLWHYGWEPLTVTHHHLTLSVQAPTLVSLMVTGIVAVGI